MKRSIWIGYEPREEDAFTVARYTCRKHGGDIPIHAIRLNDVRKAGFYTRPMSKRDGRLWDDISDAPCATEFAISRFLTPILAKEGWALFMDADMLVRSNLDELFSLADPSKAVMCVKHEHIDGSASKMDGQLQTFYKRKNWSSVMLFNCGHPANERLTIDLINTVPGRDLHAFCWLQDDEIGELPLEWNWLADVSPPMDDPAIAIVHHTLGIPSMPGYENAPFADEWRAALKDGATA